MQRSMYMAALTEARKIRRDGHPSSTGDAKADSCILTPAAKKGKGKGSAGSKTAPKPTTAPPTEKKRKRRTAEDSWYEGPWWESKPTTWWGSQWQQTSSAWSQSSATGQAGSEPAGSVHTHETSSEEDNASTVTSSAALTESNWTLTGIEEDDNSSQATNEQYGSQYDRRSARSVQSSRSSRKSWWQDRKW